MIKDGTLAVIIGCNTLTGIFGFICGAWHQHVRQQQHAEDERCAHDVPMNEMCFACDQESSQREQSRIVMPLPRASEPEDFTASGRPVAEVAPQHGLSQTR